MQHASTKIVLPEHVYQRLRNQSVRMEIDYSLTVSV